MGNTQFGQHAVATAVNMQLQKVMQTDYDGALSVLSQHTHLLVDQQVDWRECLQICEGDNKYKIFPSSPLHQQAPGAMLMMKELGLFKESSEFCCKFFLHGLREIQASIYIGGVEVAKVMAPYKCRSLNPFCSCPCTVPELYVYSPKREFMYGSLRVPYYLCWCNSHEPCPLLELEVFDFSNGPQGAPTYTIVGNCCQTSVVCLPFACMGCPVIEYNVRGQPPENPNPIGKIKNLYRDCIEECFSKADRFGIDFPLQATPRQKLLLIVATIWIDYLQYEGLPRCFP